MPNCALAVVMQIQNQYNWCWAAVSSTVAGYYQQPHSFSQCRLADWAFGITSCCGNGSSRACDQAYFLDRALAHVGNLDRVASGSLPWNMVDRELNASEPVAIRWQLAGGGSHFLLITGSGTSHNQMLTVEDPQGMKLTGPHAKISNNIYGQWAETFTTKI